LHTKKKSVSGKQAPPQVHYQNFVGGPPMGGQQAQMIGVNQIINNFNNFH
jgi:hypothetical protein